jgi:DNA-binding LytR/AlgR family response regulator
MNYTCVIVDDEPLAHQVLLEYTGRIRQLSVVRQFYSSPEALACLISNPPDILFLDIEMPELSGVEMLKQLPHKPLTIFITAFLNYSLEGYELGVLDYLVKPVRFERFELAINRAMQFLQLLRLQQELEQKTSSPSTLLIKSGTKKLIVNRSEITHVQAMKDYIIIYCGPEKYVVRSTMKEVEELLGAADFLRVHKSFIVSRKHISFSSGNRIELSGFEIPVGRKYKTVVDRLLDEQN